MIDTNGFESTCCGEECTCEGECDSKPVICPAAKPPLETAPTLPKLKSSPSFGSECIICLDATADHAFIPCGYVGSFHIRSHSIVLLLVN